MKVSTDSHTKTRFTRECIALAIIELLQDSSYSKLKVSDIVKKAGVARMTFYKHYSSPYDALKDYMSIIISEYIEECPAEQKRQTYMSYEHILYSLKFFDRYAKSFLTMKNGNLYGLLIESVNQFMEEHIQPRNKMSVYELYSYAGGLLNSFLQWEERGKKESAEEVAAAIYQLYSGRK